MYQEDHSHAVTSNGKVIYVVDDEPLLLELASAILRPLGYDVKVFRDGESALQAFAAEKPAPCLIITDYAMHRMDGMKLIESCRKLRPEQKVLLVSGTVDQRIYASSATKPDQFLAKPYSAEHLMDAVASLTR